jgi:ABC-type uncharacterized transport system auxiliary subunit
MTRGPKLPGEAFDTDIAQSETAASITPDVSILETRRQQLHSNQIFIAKMLERMRAD